MKISLRAARVNVNLTQEEAAAKLHISPKTYWNWENGKAIPSMKYLNPICNLFGVTIDDLSFFFQ